MASAGAVMAGRRGHKAVAQNPGGGGAGMGSSGMLDRDSGLQQPPSGLSSKRGSHNDPSSEVDNFRASRTSLESGLQDELDDLEDEGEIKKRMMPFFKKFWPHLDKEKRRSTLDLGSEKDEHIIEDPGGSLPSINPSWFGKPVEEVDPFIFDDTFCVISQKYNRHYIYRFSCTKSLYLLGPLNPIRRFAIFVITHRWFDILIILTILANCVTLAMIQNKFEEDGITKVVPTYDYYTDRIEYAFLAIYIMEMVLKIIAKGFVINKYSYLRNRWNMLDFIVVMSGLITIAIGDDNKEAGNLEVLRTFRVLRAVKTISILPGLRMMINALLSSVVQLLEVMALTLFCLMIFALFALEVYMGKLRQKCVLIKGGPLDSDKNTPIDPRDPDRDKLWSDWVNDPQNWKHRPDEFPDDEPIPCGNDSSTRVCGDGYVCLGMIGENPDDGWTSFDNFFKSMLTTFQLITLDYWERLYDLVLSTSGPWSVLFFVMVVFLGSFYLLNLMLAVVAMSYEAEAQNQDQGPMTKHQKLSMVRQASTFSFDDLSKLNICKMTYYRKRTPSERELIAKKLRHSSLGKRKPRRAIRRRAISKASGPERLGSVANTSVGSPRVVSTAGSICGESICGVSTGGIGTTVISTVAGGGVSPTCSVPPATITVPPTSTGSLLGSSPRGSAREKRGSSPGVEHPGGVLPTPATLSTVKERRKRSSSSGSSGPPPKPRRLKHRAAKPAAAQSSSRPVSGESRLTAQTDNSAITTTGGGGSSSGVAGDVSSVGGCTTTSSSLAPVQGGVRVSGRVKVVSSEDGDRFILDTGDGVDSDMNLGDAIFSLLGLRMNMGPEEMKKLGSLNSVTGSILTDNTISKDLVEVDVTGDETGAVAIDIGEPGQPAVVVSPPPPDPDDDAAGKELDENGSDAASDSSGEADATTALAAKNGEGATKRRTIMRNTRKISLILKTRLKPIVNHFLFEAFITICIIFNTVLLAMEHHGQSHELEEWLRKGNNVFMAVFTAECVIKVMALQAEFFHQGWNIFDIFIVGISYLDIIIETVLNLSVMRGMRLLRVFKLAQSWITMKVLLNIIFSTFGALGNLTCVLLIVIYIFAVMGMQIVGGAYTPRAFDAIDNPDNFPRWHFQNFWYAFMMVFRVLCGEWIEPLWDCLKAQEMSKKEDEGNAVYVRCFVIYLPILIVGNFIVLNLFLALLLNSFNTEELKAQRDKELEATGRADNLKTIVGMLLKKDKSEKGDTDEAGTEGGQGSLDPGTVPELSVTAAPGEDTQSNNQIVLAPANTSDPTTPISERQPSPLASPIDMDSPSGEWRPEEPIARVRFKLVARKVIMQNRKEAAERAISRAEIKLKREQNSSFFLKNPDKRASTFGLNQDPTPEQSEQKLVAGDCIPTKCWQSDFFICRTMREWNWTKWDKLRGWAVAVVGHPTFEWMILALIFASSITLAFEDVHLDERPQLKKALYILNFVFTGIFLVEMILKWFALGLWNYFTSAWTILDAFIVVVSLVSMYFELRIEFDPDAGADQGKSGASSLAALKALRTLRALRPLRAISRWQGMKIVVNALMYAIPSIFNVLLVCLLFWLVFSIMGVQFFKGKFYKCVDLDGERIDARIVPTREVCCNGTAHGWSWVNSISNFDNVLEGYLSLFQIATFEGWMELMEYAVDSVDIDMQPINDHGIHYYGFFVIFIVFGSFFTLNLFIGVIIDNFNMLKKKYEGNLLEVLLTPSQRHYYTAMKKLGRKKPRKVIKRPSSNILSPFYDIAMSRKFEIAIFFMIFMNMVIMAFEHYGQRQIVVHILAGFNSFFTTIYALEAIVKIIGLRYYYFTIPWNVFDFVLVLASIVDLMVGDLTVEFPIPPTMLRIVRVFRIGRVLRLVKAAKGIRKLLFALIVSLPALFNIGALLALITFIYAILGMALFGRAPRKWSIDDVFNFDTFMNSSLMLFRLMTAAGWNEVLDSLTVVEPVCGDYRHIKCGLPGEPECPSRALVVAYIVTYLIVSYLIVINMYIAIILENFVEANKEEEVGIVEDDLEMFYVRWSRYDPQATQFINFDQLSDFLASLDPPLALPKPNMVAIVAFNLPIARGNKIHCLDILHALVKHVLGQIDDSEEFRKLQEQMERKFQKQFPTRKLLDIVSSTRLWKIQQNAAITIQRAWRKYRLRKYPPTEKSKATQTIRTNQVAGGHSGLGGMMNRMGNLLHLSSGHQTDQSSGSKGSKGRRESIALREPNPPGVTQQTGSSSLLNRNRRSQDRISEQESSVTSSPTGTRLDTSPDISTATTVPAQSSTTATAPTRAQQQSLNSGGAIASSSSRARRLSPSRMSGGSFDVAVTYGNQLAVIKDTPNNTNGPSPLPSCPTTPSSVDESSSVIVQVHQFQ